MKQRILAFLAALCLLPGLAQAKIFLVDTDDTLRVVTASGVTTIHMYAAWADITTTALTPGASDAQVTTATTTTLVAAPSASTQRQIKGLSIRNSHASSSNVITVQFFDGATATELIQYTLLAGETLQWGEDENFRVIDASGQVKGIVAANPGTQANWGIYAEDTVHSSGDNLQLAGVVRQDANAALAADGDRTVLQVDANGYLKVVNINPNLAADNSTLSTAKVPVLPGTVSTSAPTWTNGNQSALSLQTDGSVRAAITNTPTVTANAGTNLNTSALLTTSAHDAAFGTAGSADAQVRTVQGIASMTPLQVQSNSASLATEASVDGLEGGLGAAADAAATAGSTGSVTAKLRLMTSQLDTISTNLSSLLTSSQLVDDDQTGASVHYRTSAGSTEDEHEVKGSAGRLFSITATNTNASARYLRCANQVIGSTTPGTTTVFLGLAIPGATTGAGFTTNFGPMGIAFSTGLTCWLVTGAADTDVAEVAANEIKVIYTYK